MITKMTFGPVPPPGRYSSGRRGTLSAKPAHPAAPSRDAPAAPAPATLKKSLRVNIRFLLTPGRPPQRYPQMPHSTNYHVVHQHRPDDAEGRPSVTQAMFALSASARWYTGVSLPGFSHSMYSTNSSSVSKSILGLLSFSSLSIECSRPL